MNQVAASIWNRIAELTPPRTTYGRRYFRLPENELTRAKELEAQELLRKGFDPTTVGAFQEVAPLIAEPEAISNFARTVPSIREALPEILSIPEAVQMQSRSHRLNPTQRQRLTGLLDSIANN
jgi:phosphohistidine swiveling domain-containing protein